VLIIVSTVLSYRQLTDFGFNSLSFDPALPARSLCERLARSTQNLYNIVHIDKMKFFAVLALCASIASAGVVITPIRANQVVPKTNDDCAFGVVTPHGCGYV
jgi:hypothetical protein